MVTKVRGSFNEFEGSAYVDAENPSASKVAVTVKTASSDTRNSDRDAHLRSNDFIDMDTYPEISFVSTDVEGIDEGYRVTGDLTIKGVTKPVAVDFESPAPPSTPTATPGSAATRVLPDLGGGIYRQTQTTLRRTHVHPSLRAAPQERGASA
jgi:polyisoprenoid-binding protein YceI